MARTVSLATVRELIRQQYDIPATADTSWATTIYMTSLINASLAAYYGLLIELNGDNYFAEETTITTSSGINLTSLPDRCVKVLKLWWVRGTDDVYPIKRASADDLMLAGYSAKSWDEYSPRFRLSGTTGIQWLPTPNQTYTVICHHVAMPEDLVDEADAFEAGQGHEFFVVHDVCAKLAMKEQQDPGAFLSERELVRALVASQAGERDEGEPLQLRDAYGRSDHMSAYERRNLLTQRY